MAVISPSAGIAARPAHIPPVRAMSRPETRSCPPGNSIHGKKKPTRTTAPATPSKVSMPIRLFAGAAGASSVAPVSAGSAIYQH